MLRSPGFRVAASLQDIVKLYNRFIAYLIFEIHFNTWCYYLKIDFEDFLKLWPFCLGHISLGKADMVMESVVDAAAERTDALQQEKF